MISHATSQRQTHSLNMLSGPMITDATSQEAQRQTHLLHVFSGPMVSHGTSQENRGKLTS